MAAETQVNVHPFCADPRFAGLRPQLWKPGESGNPNGRPSKAVSVTHYLHEVLAETNAEGKTHAELLARAMLKGGLKPDTNMAREILDRVEGRVPSKIELEAHILVATPDQLIEANRRMAAIEAQELVLLEAHNESGNT